MFKETILSYFPTNAHIKEARLGQKAVLNEVEKVMKDGKRLIIIEGPVGCGKSGMAITLANAFNSGHIITPRKSLQDQYFDDFSDLVVTMKGRAAYPCTFETRPEVHRAIIKAVINGSVRQPIMGAPNCASAPCRGDKEVYRACDDKFGICPYTKAIETAQQSPIVVHNLHSFIFQTSFADKFDKKEVLIIDEAHEIETTLRGFITKKFSLGIPLDDHDRPDVTNDIESWADFFLDARFVPEMSEAEKRREEMDEEYVSPATQYLQKVEMFRANKDFFKDRFSVKAIQNKVNNRIMSTTFEFVPDSLGSAARDFLFSYGEYVVLMSGTIYSKDMFCRNLGINPEEAHFIRIPSTFPVELRPLYAKPEYQVDTSHKNWNDNFEEMIEKMDKIQNIFHDAKGLIHAPSYDSAQQIVQALPGRRAITHSSHDFQEKLKMFYESDEPLIFVSPVCQQGVDFKGDRARFQIITRVPYLNSGDEFVKYKVENDFQWYNYQALIVWGQQIGRINRSEDDYGATFLMDARFNSFIRKNSKIIPKWVHNAVIYK